MPKRFIVVLLISLSLLAIACSTQTPTATITVTPPTVTIAPPANGITTPAPITITKTVMPVTITETVTPTTPAVQDVLQLLSSTSKQASPSYMSVLGEVKNISGKSQQNVEAVVTWYDSNNKVVANDEALIQYNPLAPDQTSPFEVLTPTDPTMDHFKLEFAYLGGAAIPVLK